MLLPKKTEQLNRELRLNQGNSQQSKNQGEPYNLNKMKRATLLLLVMGLFCFIQLQAQQWTVYNTINSDIPANQIGTLVIDASGNKWIGTSSGISKFDNTNWSTYSSYSHVYWGQGIALDTNDSLWLAPNSGEITMCQLNDSCYSYVDSTGYFPSSYSQFVIAIDSSNNVWTAGGAALKFDGTNWSAWTNLPAGYCIAIDANQNPWFGGGVTLNNFDGINWIQHSIIGSSFINILR
ncbi:MAG: hypothetical protein IPL86_04215 [Flavobacteriales bacterium]|nr:hypothetical protein [Flavobacteriales bacterium]